MSPLKDEIRQNMHDLKMMEDNILTASFSFPESFIGFQGHFPLKKVLPGVCQIQCIMVMLEKWKKKAVLLEEIIIAKFMQPLLPLQEIRCQCENVQETEESFVINAVIKKEGQKIAQLKLRLLMKQD